MVIPFTKSKIKMFLFVLRPLAKKLNIKYILNVIIGPKVMVEERKQAKGGLNY